jgi:hypothetical protein
MLRRPAARVFTVDHVDTAALRLKYAEDPHVRAADIGAVDIVWNDGPLRDAVARALPGAERWFAYAIASHVIEHVPDMIWWLAEIRSVLSSGAALRLVMPDRRFTMDIARRETVLADVLAAYLVAARRPQPREIIDFYSRYQNVDVVSAWRGQQKVRQIGPLDQAETAVRLAQSALAGGYHDVHCWVFTPRSFLALMVELARLGLIWFAFEKMIPTAEDTLDFCVHARAADDRRIIEASWRDALGALEAAELRAPVLPQDEPARLQDQIRLQAAWAVAPGGRFWPGTRLRRLWRTLARTWRATAG